MDSREINYKTDGSVDPVKFERKWSDYLRHNTTPIGKPAFYDSITVRKYNIRQGVGIRTDTVYEGGDTENDPSEVSIILVTDDFVKELSEVNRELSDIIRESKK